MSGFRINEIRVFTSIGEDDEEGVCAFFTGDHWMPMVAADLTRLEQLRTIASGIARLQPVFERTFVPSGEYTVVEPK